MLTTRAAVVEAPGAPFTVHEVTLDDLRAGEVLVRMVAAGLCHTDIGVQLGGIPFPLPGILGHEGAGVVTREGRASPGSHPATTSCSPSPPAGGAPTAAADTRRTARPGCRAT